MLKHKTKGIFGRYLALIPMKQFFTYSLCLAISILLLAAQVGPCYQFFLDLEIELHEGGEKNPIEDISDTELEEEKEVREQDLQITQLVEKNKKFLSNQIFNLQSPDKDVISPPPDLS